MTVDRFISGQQKITDFCRQFPQQNFSADSMLLSRGQVPETMFFLEKGCVKLSPSESGKRPITLHIFFPNSIMPLFALFDQAGGLFSLQAITPVTVRAVPREQFEALLLAEPEVTLALLQRSFMGMKGLMKRVTQSAQQSAVQQVAGLLTYFADHFGKDFQDETFIETKVTHEELSRWLGLSRENVSIHMKNLERDGLIRKQRRQVVVPNLEKLREFSLA